MDTVRRLLDHAGRSYADEAGIKLTDKPAPLYQLLVLSVLLSNRIASDIAVAAARELNRAGLGTAEKMRDATWQQRVDVLGRAHYKRYDEMTSTALGDGAELIAEEYDGDLRKLREAADRDPAKIRKLLKRVPRIADVGASIFAREAQLVWPELRPALDKKALQGAKLLGLPEQQDKLAELVDEQDLHRLAAALTRVALDKKLAPEIKNG
jgi:hypothetical protein